MRCMASMMQACIFTFPWLTGTCQDKLDKILDIVTETRALVGLHNHLSLAALWAPFSMPKRSINSASLAALCDTDFKHKVAEAMGAPEDVCMVLNKQLPQQFVCGGHIIPILQVKSRHSA